MSLSLLRSTPAAGWSSSTRCTRLPSIEWHYRLYRRKAVVSEVPKEEAKPIPSVLDTDPRLQHYARLPRLPPLDEWRSHFGPTSHVARDRISTRNPATAMKIASSFLQSKHMKSNKPKVVIEAFPGPGGLSRALLTLPPDVLGKLIILEEHEPYLEYLRPLEQADSRVKVVPRSGFNWDTYGYLEENGLLDDVEISPWEDQAHPQLHFISHIPQNIPGEQLVAQLFRNIPEKTWLFKYGRVPMSFIMSDWVWRRVSAERSDKERCKLSVIAEATSLFHVSLDPDLVSPFADHFHPVPVASSAQNRRTENRRLGTLTLPVNVTPLADQVIERGHLDTWDYVLRRLFVLKSTPLKGAISSLAPGAEILLKTITDRNLPREQRVDIGKQVRKLDIADWALLVRAFETWPFAPEDLTIDSFQSND